MKIDLDAIVAAKPAELEAFYSLSEAQTYLWQMYGKDYGQGDTPEEIVDAIKLLQHSERELGRELRGI